MKRNNKKREQYENLPCSKRTFAGRDLGETLVIQPLTRSGRHAAEMPRDGGGPDGRLGHLLLDNCPALT